MVRHRCTSGVSNRKEDNCRQASLETAARPFRGDLPAGRKGSVMAGPSNTLRSLWPALAIWGKAGDSNMKIGLEPMHVMNIHATM
jgi:hypothetical protein